MRLGNHLRRRAGKLHPQLLMKPDSVVVKYRTVSVTIWPWSPKPGLTHWRFCKGRQKVSRNTFEKAKESALAYAQDQFLGTSSIKGITDSQTRAVKRLMDADATLSDVEEFLAWKRGQRPVKMLAEARSEFLAVKLGSQGRSKYHLSLIHI